METNEALAKINEIHNVMQASNRAILSGERMIVIGALVTIIPVIELTTQHLTFGLDALSHSALVISVVHTVFYWLLFTIVGKVIPFPRLNRESLHPILKRAFSMTRPFIVGLIGIIMALVLVHQYQLIHPLVFVMLGLIFSLYGRLANIQSVSYIAWSYILIGIVYTYLSQFSLPTLWIWLTVYNGLSYVLMGVFLRQQNNKVMA